MAVSSHVPVAVAFLRVGCVTSSTTAVTSVMSEDVVRKLAHTSGLRFSVNGVVVFLK